jgi:hypothetical protein
MKALKVLARIEKHELNSMQIELAQLSNKIDEIISDINNVTQQIEQNFVMVNQNTTLGCFADMFYQVNKTKNLQLQKQLLEKQEELDDLMEKILSKFNKQKVLEIIMLKAEQTKKYEMNKKIQQLLDDLYQTNVKQF